MKRERKKGDGLIEKKGGKKKEEINLHPSSINLHQVQTNLHPSSINLHPNNNYQLVINRV